MSLLDFKMIRFPPSTLALAALVVTFERLQSEKSKYNQEFGPRAE
jgi:hypothetical protein